MASPDHNRVREVFQQAIQLPAEKQAAYVSGACHGDPELQAAVQRLLNHHQPDTLLMKSELEPQSTDPLASLGRGTTKFGETVVESPSELAIERLERQTRVTGSFRGRQRWVLPGAALGLALLLSLGWWVHSAIQQSIGDAVQSVLQAVLDEQVFAIETWLATEEELVDAWIRASEVVQAIEELDEVARSEKNPQSALADSESSEKLDESLRHIAAGQLKYAVWNREGVLIADSDADAALLGNETTEYGASLLSRVYRGETVLWMPSRAGFITRGFTMKGGMQKAHLAMIAPVYGTNRERPIAAMLVSDPSRQARFEQLLAKARLGETGETYAFTEDGYLISESRFVDQLRSVGLVEDSPEAFSAQVVRVADPGGNLLEGYQPTLEPSEWPLTQAARSATQGHAGENFIGYRDYRGVPVVGAWAWLPKYRFAVVTEVDYANAYSSLSPLNRAFGIIFACLIVVAVIAVGTSFALLRIQQNSDHPVSVGPYTLKSLLGEGGFARVYLATHALLKRPTAVKVLRSEQINPRNIARFEREVQLASGLSHPNTIGIYDYGATADGSFYYAMEYIKGPSLQELVEQHGPQRPERVVWILTQLCRSLREAHNKGLIHRDIKPQNVMLCRRGGDCDFVKVLDFGLARSFEADRNRVTETKLLIGTPLYIAPERILDPTCMDPRSDIYSVGILGYFLLTGREPFVACGSIDALAQTINRAARQPSEESPGPIPLALDRLIRDCHSRVVTERPQTVDQIVERLDAVPLEEKWTVQKAAAWWDEHQRAMVAEVDTGSAASTVDRGKTVAVGNRDKA